MNYFFICRCSSRKLKDSVITITSETINDKLKTKNVDFFSLKKLITVRDLNEKRVLDGAMLFTSFSLLATTSKNNKDEKSI